MQVLAEQLLLQVLGSFPMPDRYSRCFLTLDPLHGYKNPRKQNEKLK